MRKPSRRSARLLVAAIATPVFLIAVAQPASAAELAPVAEYIDTTVADTEAMIGAVIDALGFAA